MNHPQGCLGYRIDTAGGSVVYATDNEPGAPTCDQNLRQLAHGADVLIYDAQYSPEQLASARKGWGHSSWLEGVKIAREAKVRNLILFHHDPDSPDKVVDGFLSAARQEFPATWAAAEGMSITLSERGVDVDDARNRDWEFGGGCDLRPRSADKPKMESHSKKKRRCAISVCRALIWR